MKRILFDHNVPRPLRRWLNKYDVHICKAHGWQELSNGALLAAAEEAGLSIFFTADKQLRYQQNLAHRRLAIVELPTNKLRLLVELVPLLVTAIERAQSGSYQIIPMPDDAD